MHTSRVLRLLAFFSVAAAVAVITAPTAPAASTFAQAPKLSADRPQPLLQLAARKGTRSFHSDADAPAAATAPAAHQQAAVKTSDALQACLDTWDHATHISKPRWREICKEQIKERQDLEAGVVQ